jgi:DNA-binding transcriptional ArsR family regulator
VTAGPTTDPNARLIKAMGHPLRFRILLRLNEGASSPSTLARELGEPLGNVAYHVKILLEQEAIELIDTRPVRGAIEHIYRAIARPYFGDDNWAQLPLSVRQTMFAENLQQMWEHVAAAAQDGGLDHPQTHVSSMTLDLDPEGYEEVVGLLGQTLDRMLEIQAETAERSNGRAGDDAETERTELAILHYHRPPAGD